MSQTSALHFMRVLYPDDMKLDLLPRQVPPRDELLRWSAQCMRELAFAERIGSQASCYIKGGQSALDNIRQFAAYAATHLERIG